MNYRIRFLLNFLRTDDLLSDGVNLDKILKKYDKGHILPLQDTISKYLKNENTWMTAIGIIDAMDAVFEASKENGLIKAGISQE